MPGNQCYRNGPVQQVAWQHSAVGVLPLFAHEPGLSGRTTLRHVPADRCCSPGCLVEPQGYVYNGNVFHRSHSAPVKVLQRYEKWKDIVKISGPQGLKLIRGFHDEALTGNWEGFRSSRLNIQYRVIYKVQKDQAMVEVERVTPHDYRR